MKQGAKKDEGRGELTSLEMGVLGAAVMAPVKVFTLMSEWDVAAEWFESEMGQTIFKVLHKMFMDGEPIDVVTAEERVRLVAGTAGAVALVKALDFVPSGSYGAFYLDLVRDAWFTRVCRSTAIDLSSSLAAGDVDRKLLVSEAINKLVNLMEFSAKGRDKTPYELRQEVLQGWIDAEAGIKSAMGLPFPFSGANALTCGIPDGVTVIAARPSVGKTVMEGCISRPLLIAGYRVARVCLDMTVLPFVSRDLCAMGGESLNKMRAGFMKGGARSKMEASLAAMKPWREELVTERTSAGIIAKLRALIANGGLDLVTIDYIQLVDTVGEEKYMMNDNVRISRAMARFKDFNARTGVPVIVLSQLSRGVEKDDRIPQLSDLRDSGSIEQDATVVAFLYPEPTVTKKWCERAGVDTFKELAVRPIVFDFLKQQNGSVGKIACRQIGEYFKFEECGAWDPHLSDPDDCHGGYDFNSVKQPVTREDSQNVYVICQHPLGSVTMFEKVWFDKVNAAVDEGERYVDVGRAVGVFDAVAKMAAVRDRLKAEQEAATRRPPVKTAELALGGAYE